LDAEDAAGGGGSGTATPQGVNGKKADAKDKDVEKATEALKETSLEDKKQEVTA
jgi:hypothetical protein